ncbi:phage tail protein [Amycolatopsis sp. NBC_01488]|uniref:phage tail protein n=1 Tax=Amycolatopsis sp. NBC_01488 TaxID=2903563 RepID=UPI002E2E32CC|nr:phage tail protein [Amycolatopsis sp. NBC_01488]
MAEQYVSAARFVITCEGWAVGLGFSEMSGFNSTVEHQEYSYNGRIGNVHTKQFGRPKPPSVTLKRALDAAGFGQLFAWHALARANSPLAKVPATFTIMDAAGTVTANVLLENAWCAKLELDPATAGSSNVVMMKTTIECDAVLLI